MSKLGSFDKARRERLALTDDATEWTVEDAVMHFLDTIRELPEDEKPNEPFLVAESEGAVWRRCAGMSNADLLFTLEREKLCVLLGTGGEDE